MKKWQIKEVGEQLVKALSTETGLSPFICRLLAGRGICSRDDAEDFFHGEELSSPFDITDMRKAAETIQSAIENETKITVYGDYDCDGVTSTVMLFGYLQSVGAECDWYIPDRSEGYGMNLSALKKIADDGTGLVVTVDNGISAFEEATYLAERGVKLVITDHHQVPETLPEAEAIVNPHRRDDYSSFKELAGCGVVLKLIMALENDIDSVFEQFGDLAAIGTVGDLVPLVGENRIIVKRGLEIMPMTGNAGLFSLLKQCGLDGEITSNELAFIVCPRINAAGRFASPRDAAELFLFDDNQKLAALKAEQLSLFNSERQKTEAQIIGEIEAAIRADRRLLNSRLLILSGKNWSHGVIGIVASRLLSKYGKPVIIITIEGETARGSARSIDGFSLYKLLDANKALLEKFGGHTKAAGFSLSAEKVDELKEAFQSYATTFYPTMPSDSYTADMELSSAELSLENVESLSFLQPFGEQNPAPLFMMRGCLIKSVRALKDGKYVSFNVLFGKSEHRILHFGSTYDSFTFKAGDNVDLLVSAEINEYNDTRSISLRVRDMRFSGFNQDKFFAAKSAYEKTVLGEAVNPSLLKRIVPEKKDMMKVYDLLKKEKSLSGAAQRAFAEGINYCMFRVILDVFDEFGIAVYDPVSDTAALVPAAKKADFSASRHLSALREQIEKGEKCFD